MAKNTNSNSKTSTTKKTVAPSVVNSTTKKSTKSVNEQITDTFFNSNTKTPPVTKNTGSGSNQLGKKRGSYAQNLWAIEFRVGDKYLASPIEVYLSRDDAREALNFFRGESNYQKGDARLAKYTFSRADHS